MIIINTVFIKKKEINLFYCFKCSKCIHILYKINHPNVV